MTDTSTLMANRAEKTLGPSQYSQPAKTAEELQKTIRSVTTAATEPTIIDVLVNGNTTLAPRIRDFLEFEPSYETMAASHTLRIWHIKTRRQRTRLETNTSTFSGRIQRYRFLSMATCSQKPDALTRLARHFTWRSCRSRLYGGRLQAAETALRIREEMLSDGGLHGNLFALRSQTIEELRHTHFELALGLYSFDTVLCAILAYGLDPQTKQWDAKGRIIVAPDVTWTTEEKALVASCRCKKTQLKTLHETSPSAYSNARLQNTIFRSASCRLAVFPKRVDDYVLTWMSECPEHAQKTLWRSPLSRIALRKNHPPNRLVAGRSHPRVDSLRKKSETPYKKEKTLPWPRNSSGKTGTQPINNPSHSTRID